MYPEYANIKGKEYKIDTDFSTALKCFEIVEDNTITDYERALAIVYLIFDFIPTKDLDLFLEKAIAYLQCGKTYEEQNQNNKDMDFIQDKKYINSSFMSDYHIDLSKTKIHFWQFIDLLEGLTENSSLSRIRELRNYDTKQIKDNKEKKKIEEAQRQVALKNKRREKLTEEQEKSVNAFYELTGIKRKE